VIDEFGQTLRDAVLLDVETGAGADEQGAGHAPNDRIGVVDGTHSDR
jgi:hypothetical protein